MEVNKLYRISQNRTLIRVERTLIRVTALLASWFLLWGGAMVPGGDMQKQLYFIFPLCVWGIATLILSFWLFIDTVFGDATISIFGEGASWYLMPTILVAINVFGFLIFIAADFVGKILHLPHF